MTTLEKKLDAMQDQRSPAARRLNESVMAGIGWLMRKPRSLPVKHNAWALREQWWALVLFTFGVVLACMFFVDVAATLNARRLPQLFVDVVNQFTDFGKSVWTLWPAGVVLAACLIAGATNALTSMQHRVLAAIAVRAQFVFIAIAIPGLFVAVVKRIVGRGRPLSGDQNLPSAFHYIPFPNDLHFTGMPSGHATAAFSALVVLGSLWPKARPYLWIYAIAIGLSRVIVLSHFVSDVIVGALVGSFGAIMIRNAFMARGLIFYRDEFGHVTPKPGPSWRRIKALARTIRGQ